MIKDQIYLCCYIFVQIYEHNNNDNKNNNKDYISLYTMQPFSYIKTILIEHKYIS